MAKSLLIPLYEWGTIKRVFKRGAAPLLSLPLSAGEEGDTRGEVDLMARKELYARDHQRFR
jgi:hypothetical protein